MDIAPPVAITTGDPALFGDFFARLYVGGATSHKGQNGKVLVIGGSSLFHGAVIWPAEVASHFADMVHVSSTAENNDIIRTIKEHWQNGIVVSQKDMDSYIQEDDVVLLGNGLMRTDRSFKPQDKPLSLTEVLNIADEGERTYYLTKYLLGKHQSKKWVLDAGAVQMMDPHWLFDMKVPTIVTPHQKEFEKLFGISVIGMSEEDKVEVVAETARRYKTVILLKSGYDVVTDGARSYVIHGGNAGLTKGGTGDILAGITAALYAKNQPLESAVCASLLLKLTAEELYETKGVWFNNADIVAALPGVMNGLMKRHGNME